ncbi:ribosome hibernation-promoting factor, HPF/YfiA family [Magnetospira sp. QH-2]|uniref:ribosome hibernation-promoting factor, HPF/YfiA family n=1 Tax=Magnetospira sp. (strain QH-2) TaxID=1288970 RepID=UPI0003E80E7A|nr:ribosome-associated translation inhibitor RaiA [Magnetospira sp. QH-2]CCQ75133.1 putative sigma 54 modulation protein/ribosomal protein S30EA [Magnetospira sp. QH-2]
MDITVKGKNMDVGEALGVHVDDTLSAVVAKYFDRAIDATVVFSKEAHQFRSDIQVHAGRGLVVQGVNKGNEAYGAFDGALERIDKQLRRYKRRIKDYHKDQATEAKITAQQYVLAPEDDSGVDEPVGDEAPVIIAELPTQVDNLTVSQAVMRMDLADQCVMLFHNRAHGRLNVVYRRPDGNIGWIDPEGSES